jgi:hypothetical protein
MDWLLTRRASLSRAGKRVSQCVHQHRGSQNLPRGRRLWNVSPLPVSRP